MSYVVQYCHTSFPEWCHDAVCSTFERALCRAADLEAYFKSGRGDYNFITRVLPIAQTKVVCC